MLPCPPPPPIYLSPHPGPRTAHITVRADPGAYNELHYNVAMNPHVSKNTETAQLCISDAPGTLMMHGELGSSMSTLLEYPGAADHRKNNNT